MENIDFNDGCYCPKCGAECRSVRCRALGCDDGFYLDEDGINGNSLAVCDDCHGTGIERWCPVCKWEWRGEELVTDCDYEQACQKAITEGR